ncbi:pseudaminic acid cytidylyltransferase [Helicobacter sp. MIT 00-7814]|uniref:cytidylyltransferase domain-containing protein n=1 Tax=unclassified Helicobacter TaxID=2593540 RepID=UPI000E1E8F7F|nr:MULTISPECIES: pseudaminic acid cytidylyltransferase [unclassified Helicobacter]RDU51667.1 pseudaminic acid cytidylyltransferase [Helicobacter sp. MIT 00-7814]RDU52386.1 pseudaminic acid cytidylyltransferase [Helicobacter sp. MIT 99-10781]
MKTIAIIPARAGSKRIPHKNIKPFLGKPILSYPIACALESRLFDEIVVSTDSQEIAEVANAFGAQTPFLRPAHLSDDFAPTLSVIAHAARELKLKSQDIICCIYPATPLLQAHILQNAFALLQAQKSAQYVFSVLRFSHNPLRGFRLESTQSAPQETRAFAQQKEEILAPQAQAMGFIKPLETKFQNTRTQDLEPLFYDAGQFYFGRAGAFLEELPIFAPHSLGIELDFFDAQDIDTPADWELAEFKYRYKFNLF